MQDKVCRVDCESLRRRKGDDGGLKKKEYGVSEVRNPIGTISPCPQVDMELR